MRSPCCTRCSPTGPPDPGPAVGVGQLPAAGPGPDQLKYPTGFASCGFEPNPRSSPDATLPDSPGGLSRWRGRGTVMV